MRPGAPNDKSKTCYLVVVDATGQFYHSVNGFEAFDNAHSTSYAFAVVDTNAVGWYDRASLTGPADDTYEFRFYEQAGGSPALQTDSQFWVETKALESGVWTEPSGGGSSGTTDELTVEIDDETAS